MIISLKSLQQVRIGDIHAPIPFPPGMQPASKTDKTDNSLVDIAIGLSI